MNTCTHITHSMFVHACKSAHVNSCIGKFIQMEEAGTDHAPTVFYYSVSFPPFVSLSYYDSYYPDIFNKSGFREVAEKYGEWFTYRGSPRAKIYARNHTMVTDLPSMIALMR